MALQFAKFRVGRAEDSPEAFLGCIMWRSSVVSSSQAANWLCRNSDAVVDPADWFHTT